MQYLRISASILAMTSLAACGGGGGPINSNATVPPVASAPPADTTTGSVTPAPAPSPAPSTSTTAAGAVVTPANAQPVRSTNDSAEYRQNYVANELVNALYALDHGWTGQGVAVGVLDDGVDAGLAALQGQISPLSKDFGYETRSGVTTKRDQLGDAQSDHGTAVAAIIAARADGSRIGRHRPGRQDRGAAHVRL